MALKTAGKVLGMVGQAAGIGGGIYSAIRSRKAAKESHERAKELQDRAHQQQYDMWQKTNYPAQVEQLKKAGLNPALLYGQSGGGGVSTGAGNVASGAQEQVYDVAGAMNQSAMTAAQLDLVKAQAEKTRAEAENIGGVDKEAKETANRLAAIDLQVREAIGAETLTRQAQIEIERLNTENAQKLRELETWMEEAFSGDFSDGEGSIKVDAYGAYTTSEKNDWIRKVMRAGFEYTVKDLERLKRDLTLKDDQHTLNQIEMEIRSFKEDLSRIGLNETTAAILTKLLQLVFGRR